MKVNKNEALNTTAIRMGVREHTLAEDVRHFAFVKMVRPAPLP